MRRSGCLWTTRRLRAKLVVSTIPNAMKKLLLLFMLVMLPLQASWGVVSGYCQPEQSPCVTPCYYDVQEIFVEANSNGDDNTPSKANIEHDAHSCHVYCMPLIGVSHTNTFAPSSSSARQVVQTRHLLATINERPERPQWSDVA
jgi:hypothetical protein